MHGNGKELFGDGFAVWYARDRMEEGKVFGSKDLFYGLAVILDTYSNHNGAHTVSRLFLPTNWANGQISIASTPLYICDGKQWYYELRPR